MSRRPGPFAVVWPAAALFLAVFACLAFQLRSGNDPAIGAGSKEAAAEPRRVLIRRVIVTRKRPAATGGTAPAVGAAPAEAAAAPAPSAAAPAAPAPAAPAPAPAPVPAPVTRSS